MRSRRFESSRIRIQRGIICSLNLFPEFLGVRVAKFEDLRFALFSLSERRFDNGGYRTAWRKFETVRPALSWSKIALDGVPARGAFSVLVAAQQIKHEFRQLRYLLDCSGNWRLDANGDTVSGAHAFPSRNAPQFSAGHRGDGGRHSCPMWQLTTVELYAEHTFAHAR